jgi:hypothetical protein
MALLFDQLKTKSAAWRKQGFPHEEFSPIAEILEWASSPDGSGCPTAGHSYAHRLLPYWQQNKLLDERSEKQS